MKNKNQTFCMECSEFKDEEQIHHEVINGGAICNRCVEARELKNELGREQAAKLREEELLCKSNALRKKEAECKRTKARLAVSDKMDERRLQKELDEMYLY